MVEVQETAEPAGPARPHGWGAVSPQRAHLELEIVHARHFLDLQASHGSGDSHGGVWKFRRGKCLSGARRCVDPHITTTNTTPTVTKQTTTHTTKGQTTRLESFAIDSLSMDEREAFAVLNNTGKDTPTRSKLEVTAGGDSVARQRKVQQQRRKPNDSDTQDQQIAAHHHEQLLLAAGEAARMRDKEIQYWWMGVVGLTAMVTLGMKQQWPTAEWSIWEGLIVCSIFLTICCSTR